MTTYTLGVKLKM